MCNRFVVAFLKPGSVVLHVRHFELGGRRRERRRKEIAQSVKLSVGWVKSKSDYYGDKIVCCFPFSRFSLSLGFPGPL